MKLLVLLDDIYLVVICKTSYIIQTASTVTPCSLHNIEANAVVAAATCQHMVASQVVLFVLVICADSDIKKNKPDKISQRPTKQATASV